MILEPKNPENWLTNGKTWSKKVYLATNANPKGWRETSEQPPAPPEEPDPAQAEYDTLMAAYERGVNNA